jgi:hypothetical protein
VYLEAVELQPTYIKSRFFNELCRHLQTVSLCLFRFVYGRVKRWTHICRLRETKP